jgi:phosphatidylglycerophosphate synthase
MRVWIDAAAAAPDSQVFGMSTVERHARAARRAGIAPHDVLVDGGARGADHARALLGRELAGQGFTIVAGDGDVAQRLRTALERSATPLIAVSGDCVADPRLLAELAREAGSVVVTDSATVPRALPEAWSRVYGGWTARGDGRTSVLRLEPGVELPPASTVNALGAALLASGRTRHFDASGRDQHLAMQRRDVPFWIRNVGGDANRGDVERFLFDASYKGSTDVFTRYVFPYVVWPMVQHATRLRIRPNTISAVSVVATLAAVPCFAYGWWVLGLVLAWTMCVLDSVDGKVARLTFSDSRLGELLDHGLDIVHPPIWYLAWAIGLSGLPPVAALLDGRMLAVPIFQAALLMLALYVADRLVLAVYKARYRRGLHGHSPLDAQVRSFISRRNINLPFFTVALLAGLAVPAFYLIVAWQLLTVLWHAARTAWILARRELPQAAA